MAASMATCHSCHLLARIPPAKKGEGHRRLTCPRCNSALHFRKHNPIQRTWALVLAACIFYIPANLLPIMSVSSMGRGEASTIMSGVIHLFLHGMWPLATLVFFASVVVPLAKLIALVYLLISVQRHSKKRPVERTRLFRLTHAVGRWSMVDIYVVTILAALVQLGNLATVKAEVGAIFFGAVVVVTMLAAETFDPRIIWDRCGAKHG